ncbi:MAG TPA: thioredoxin-dependent thiol peroxidase [Patescibacteria group bacterium]|nr:thioredoxin-dependent thiol peroxidase [Patescibacteria group bacterium]
MIKKLTQKEGDSAIDFSLPDQDGKYHSLTNYHGKWVVLYFYPKDDTPGCTKEACSFRDSFRELTKLNVVVLGVSKDSVKSHKKFAEKYDLNFPILSDESKETIIAYGAWGPKKFMGREYDGIIRMTYLINPDGNIEKIYPKVNPLTHAEEIIQDLDK